MDHISVQVLEEFLPPLCHHPLCEPGSFLGSTILSIVETRELLRIRTRGPCFGEFGSLVAELVPVNATTIVLTCCHVFLSVKT